MKEKQLIQSLQTQELHLTGWRKWKHYEIVVFFIFLTIVPLFIFIKDLIIGIPRTFEEMWAFVLITTILFSSLAWLYYKVQRKKLKFTVVKTNLTRDELDKIIEKAAEAVQGRVVVTNKDRIEIKTHPSLWTGSWGELITILFDNRIVLINSICNPDKRTSITSYGRNKKNTEKLIEEIEKGKLEDFSANGS